MPSGPRLKIWFFYLPKDCTVLNHSVMRVDLPLFQRVDLFVVFANHGCEKGACLDLPIHLRLWQNVEHRTFRGRQLQLVRIGVFHTGGYGPSRKKVDMFGSPERGVVWRDLPHLSRYLFELRPSVAIVLKDAGTQANGRDARQDHRRNLGAAGVFEALSNSVESNHSQYSEKWDHKNEVHRKRRMREQILGREGQREPQTEAKLGEPPGVEAVLPNEKETCDSQHNEQKIR